MNKRFPVIAIFLIMIGCSPVGRNASFLSDPPSERTLFTDLESSALVNWREENLEASRLKLVELYRQEFISQINRILPDDFADLPNDEQNRIADLARKHFIGYIKGARNAYGYALENDSELKKMERSLVEVSQSVLISALKAEAKRKSESRESRARIAALEILKEDWMQAELERGVLRRMGVPIKKIIKLPTPDQVRRMSTPLEYVESTELVSRQTTIASILSPRQLLTFKKLMAASNSLEFGIGQELLMAEIQRLFRSENPPGEVSFSPMDFKRKSVPTGWTSMLFDVDPIVWEVMELSPRQINQLSSAREQLAVEIGKGLSGSPNSLDQWNEECARILGERYLEFRRVNDDVNGWRHRVPIKLNPSVQNLKSEDELSKLDLAEYHLGPIFSNGRPLNSVKLDRSQIIQLEQLDAKFTMLLSQRAVKTYREMKSAVKGEASSKIEESFQEYSQELLNWIRRERLWVIGRTKYEKYVKERLRGDLMFHLELKEMQKKNKSKGQI
jgi:hypothetical protein